MTQDGRRFKIELSADEALVFYEYLSKKADLEEGEFADEFEDKAEDLVATFVCVGLEEQWNHDGLIDNDMINRI